MFNEIHPLLNSAQLDDIADFRSVVARKTPEESLKLLYEWTKTGNLNFRRFKWALIYLSELG